MDTELAVGEVQLVGGKLAFSSTEKVGKMIIDGGELIYAGAINAGEVIVGADSIKVIFSAEDIAANELTVLNYDYLDLLYDANEVFIACDENGNELGGEFSIIDGLGGAGSLVYTVPEPATIAALLGAACLAYAAMRRRR